MNITVLGCQSGRLDTGVRESNGCSRHLHSGQDGAPSALSAKDEEKIPLSPKSSPESPTPLFSPLTFARQTSPTWDLPATRGRVLDDPEDVIKHQVRQTLLRNPYDVSVYYKDTGPSQMLARSPLFENIMMLVIAFNSVWICIDTDYNPSEVLSRSPLPFQVAEHCFCTIFVCEWMIRFMAFHTKSNGLNDGWFVFDTLLVFVMVLDTWVLQMVIEITGDGSGSFNPSILRLLRLFRFFRVARMARLLRFVPELMILIKGMAAAMRSVLLALVLILSVTYVFGIACTQLTANTESGSLYFSRVPHAMYSLIIYCTLLDSIGKLLSVVMDDNPFVACLLFIFVFVSAMTLMNLLIGILCEVVSNVAQYEKEEAAVMFVKGKLQSIVESFDRDKDNMISKAEFQKLIKNTEAIKALHEVGVDPAQLVDIADVIFESASAPDDEQFDGRVDFPSFMELVLEMRGCNTCTVKEVVELKRFIRQLAEDTHDQVQLVSTQIENLTRLLPLAWTPESAQSQKSSYSLAPCGSGMRPRGRRSLFSTKWASQSNNSEELVSPPVVKSTKTHSPELIQSQRSNSEELVSPPIDKSMKSSCTEFIQSESSISEELISPPLAKSMKAHFPELFQSERVIKRLDTLRPMPICVGSVPDKQTSSFCNELVTFEKQIMDGFTNLQALLLELKAQEQTPAASACEIQCHPSQKSDLPHLDIDPNLLQPDCAPHQDITASPSSLPGRITTSPKAKQTRQREARGKLQDLHEQVEGLLRTTSMNFQRLKDQYSNFDGALLT